MNSTTPWIKATRSGGTGGDCVEVRRHRGAIEVRDSKDQTTGPVLRFTPAAFRSFVDYARADEFGRPADES